MSKDKFYNSSDLEKLLRNRFCPPEWAFIPQVRNGTGYIHGVRTADAIAMGLWPSRGLYLNGFEIKVNRGDWLSELKNPAKADEVAQFCDFWWIVAPKEIVKIEELPTLWGLMIPFGSTTKILKQAQIKESSNPDKLFLAAILRRAQEIITPESQLKNKFNEGIEYGKKEANQSFEYERNKHEELLKLVNDFKKNSGVEINSWQSEEIGEAVKLVMGGAHLREKENLKHLLKQAKGIVEDIEKNLEEQKEKKVKD